MIQLISSGHCMMEDDKLGSPKTFSAATSPIKETLHLRELGKKLVSKDVQTERYSSSGIFHRSSSSEKVNTKHNIYSLGVLILHGSWLEAVSFWHDVNQGNDINIIQYLPRLPYNIHHTILL